MKSLRSQLSVGLALSLVGLLTLQWAVVTLTIDHLIQAQMIERMEQEAESLLASVQIDARGRPGLPPHAMSAVYQRPFSGRYYLLLSGPTVRLQSRSLWDHALPVVALPVGAQTLAHVSGPESQPLLLLGHGYRKQQQQVTIYIAESLQSLQQSMRVFHWIYGLLSLLGLLALLALQRGIIVSRLKPLQQIRERLASVASGEAQQITGQAPAEIMPLVSEFNRILKHTAQQSKRSRLASGNLAHALKTRLAQLQLAQGAEPKDMRVMVQASIDDMHHEI
ncbi:MAG TPA: ATP-binding protein, partial [Methylophilus sp.]